MLKVSESAAKLIVMVMKRHSMSLMDYAFDVRITRGTCGIGFVREVDGIVKNFYGLRVNIDPRFTDNMLIDVREIDGKTGLVFLENENVS